MAPLPLDQSPRVYRWKRELAALNVKVAEITSFYERVKAAAPSSEAAKSSKMQIAKELLEEAKSYQPAIKHLEDRIREYAEVSDLELVSIGEAASGINPLANNNTGKVVSMPKP